MIPSFDDVAKRLDEPLDWVVVGGSALAALVLDGILDLLPGPFFTPLASAFAAAVLGLVVKRGFDARRLAVRRSKLRSLLTAEIARIAAELTTQGSSDAASDLLLDRDLALLNDDLSRLEHVLRDARSMHKAGKGRS